jgi:hypothetical protein
MKLIESKSKQPQNTVDLTAEERQLVGAFRVIPMNYKRIIMDLAVGVAIDTQNMPKMKRNSFRIIGGGKKG